MVYPGSHSANLHKYLVIQLVVSVLVVQCDVKLLVVLHNSRVMGLCAGFYGHSLLSPPRSGQTIPGVQSAVKGTLTPMFYYFAICHRGRGVVALGTHRIKLIFLQAEVVEVVMGWGEGGATWICVTLSQTELRIQRR